MWRMKRHRRDRIRVGRFGKLSRLKKLIGADEMYSIDAEKRERRGGVRRKARGKEGAGEAGESRKGESWRRCVS